MAQSTGGLPFRLDQILGSKPLLSRRRELSVLSVPWGIHTQEMKTGRQHSLSPWALLVGGRRRGLSVLSVPWGIHTQEMKMGLNMTFPVTPSGFRAIFRFLRGTPQARMAGTSQPKSPLWVCFGRAAKKAQVSSPSGQSDSKIAARATMPVPFFNVSFLPNAAEPQPRRIIVRTPNAPRFAVIDVIPSAVHPAIMAQFEQAADSVQR